MITELTPELFRQTLAGLADVSAGEDMFPDDYRELASDFVLLLFIGFNRKEMDPKTKLLGRVESAIKKGLAECDGDDVDRFVSAALNHVMAAISVIACQSKALEIQERLQGLTDGQRPYFLKYISEHHYPAFVLGRQKWELQKELQKETKSLLEAAE